MTALTIAIIAPIVCKARLVPSGVIFSEIALNGMYPPLNAFKRHSTQHLDNKKPPTMAV